MRRGRENQCANEGFEPAVSIWTRSAHFHTGQWLTTSRTNRPDRRQHHDPNASTVPSNESCIPGGVHRRLRTRIRSKDVGAQSIGSGLPEGAPSCQAMPRWIDPRPACRRARFSNATLRCMAAWRPPNSSRIWTAPLRIARSIRASSSRIAGSVWPWPVGSAHPRITRLARSVSPDVRATATTSTDRSRRCSRAPEPAVRVAPRPERSRGVVAGLGVDEQRAGGVQRDRHL